MLRCLAELSKIFQTTTFNFSSATEHIEEAKRILEQSLAPGKVAEKLMSHWEQFSTDLGEWQDAYTEQLDRISEDYLQSLTSSIDDRFPDHKILTAFGIFNPAMIPEDFEKRKLHGMDDLNILINQFKSVLQLDGMNTDKLKVDWPSFVERVYTKRIQLDTTEKVCSYVIKDVHYKEIFPEISRLASIALSRPLTTVDPERGFAALNDVKTKKRNRLLDVTTSAMLNILINGEQNLPLKSLSAVADKWKNVRNRRNLVNRGIQDSADYAKKVKRADDSQRRRG